MFYITQEMRDASHLFLLVLLPPEAHGSSFSWGWSHDPDRSTPFGTLGMAQRVRNLALEQKYWSRAAYDCTRIVGQDEASIIQVMQS